MTVQNVEFLILSDITKKITQLKKFYFKFLLNFSKYCIHIKTLLYFLALILFK